MAREGDVENQPSSHEQTPLLHEVQSDQPSNLSDHENKRTRRYAWRIFWTIAAAFVVVIFVKGWIDAGSDVDVRCHYPDVCLPSD